MNKEIRNAVRCYIFDHNKIVCIKHLKNRIGFYDIPGGKIEDGETAEEAAIRECQEETGLTVSDLRYKGIMYVEYPDRSFSFKTFVANKFEGHIKNFEENITEILDIEDFLSKEKRFSNTILLEKFFIHFLHDQKKNFEIYIKCDNNENIINFNLKTVDL